MRINYLSEFKIVETSQTTDDLVPFKFTYYTSKSAGYVVSCDGENYVNCRLADEGNLLVIFENHGLNPGELYVKREYYCSDSDFVDGVYNLVSVENTNIELTTNKSSDTTVSVELSPNYTRGYSAYEIACQKGFEGTQNEWLMSLVVEANMLVVSADFDSTQSDMVPRVLYQHVASPTAISISLADDDTLPEEVLREYMMSFETGDVAPTFTYPEGVIWCGYVDDDNLPMMEINTHYEINIVEGRGIIIKW